MQKMKGIFSLFILAIFLFPVAEIDIHQLSHRNDFHCSANNSHIHTAEHHCHLCDIINDNFVAPVLDHIIFVINEPAIASIFFSENLYFPQNKDFQPLRGPPALI